MHWHSYEKQTQLGSWELQRNPGVRFWALCPSDALLGESSPVFNPLRRSGPDAARHRIANAVIVEVDTARIGPAVLFRYPHFTAVIGSNDLATHGSRVWLRSENHLHETGDV